MRWHCLHALYLCKRVLPSTQGCVLFSFAKAFDRIGFLFLIGALGYIFTNIFQMNLGEDETFFLLSLFSLLSLWYFLIYFFSLHLHFRACHFFPFPPLFRNSIEIILVPTRNLTHHHHHHHQRLSGE